MCGIAGYFSLQNETRVPSDALNSMISCLSHRGPDGHGSYEKDNVGLGHTRLAIIDLEGGVQPMTDSETGLALVLNGEIYNYIELRDELLKLGHYFKTDSDTEVVLKAFKQWGISCQEKFNGMWSFALYDSKAKELFLSRDRLGEKPLNYTVYNQTLVFGSEMKALKAFGVPFVIDPEVLELYLFLTNIPLPRTFYKNIYKLRPGYYLRVREGSVQELKYWDLPEIDERDMIKDKNEVNRKFKELFYDSVRLRMRSDVPFGAFLSGGLDSSAVVAAMTKYNSSQIETFTIGFKDKDFDESALAGLVAAKFRTKHHLDTVTPDGFHESLKQVHKHFDEPFGDSSAIPTGYVSRAASSRVKMVLTGDGGDEVLSGYNSYLGLKISERYKSLPRFIRHGIPAALSIVAPMLSNKRRYKINKMIGVARTAELAFEERMVRKMPYTDYETIKELTKGKKVIAIEDFVSDFFKKYSFNDPFYKLMFFDFKHNLPDDYLVKVDRMSMAHSLEARVPFLDHRLVEFMCRVDKKVKMEGWQTKSVLRNTMGPELPPDLLTAKKRGFGIPVREWFKSNDFTTELNALVNSQLLDKRVLTRIVEENRNGTKDNGNFIWALFVLHSFSYLDSH